MTTEDKLQTGALEADGVGMVHCMSRARGSEIVSFQFALEGGQRPTQPNI